MPRWGWGGGTDRTRPAGMRWRLVSRGAVCAASWARQVSERRLPLAAALPCLCMHGLWWCRAASGCAALCCTRAAVERLIVARVTTASAWCWLRV